jgi:hypothetical protein
MIEIQFALDVIDQWVYYTLVYAVFLVGYLYVYRKIYWGIFDPMFLSITNMVGSAFCVFYLQESNMLQAKYGWSFISTEIALLLGLFIANRLPFKSETSTYLIPDETVDKRTNIKEFDIFALLVCLSYLIVEFISFKVVGIVLLKKGVNHVSAFQEYGILRACIKSLRTIATIVIFYKILILGKKPSYFEILCGLVLIFGVLTSGSKSSILSFFFTYFMMSYPLVYQKRRNKIKLPLPLIISIALFPVIIVGIVTDTEPIVALQQVYYRILASGDVFLLGYHDEVMKTITETNYLKYLLYPGWGSILKNIGIGIEPPVVVGVDVFKYYNPESDGGANGRHNYLGLHFFGFWGAIVHSILIGVLIGVIRQYFKKMNPFDSSYFKYILFTILALNAAYFIDDVIIFSNYNFWTILFFIITYVVTKLIYIPLKSIAEIKYNGLKHA